MVSTPPVRSGFHLPEQSGQQALRLAEVAGIIFGVARSLSVVRTFGADGWAEERRPDLVWG